ncbi:hypothetical protein Ddye_005427 [Dipteronia dyeriana]|uniref:MULE transposase domain-containing protein n=1 Tax=Dipteronia dyeriana TaxID=168575 RepID=A0AAD9XG83_9ROSI|nr:hypothetical protein Ddye_005427 [Dipteronia dyeriana]
MLGEDRVIPHVCVSLIERVTGGVIGEEIPPRDNTQEFRSSGRSNQLFQERSWNNGRENLYGVPPEVADHGELVGGQFDDVFGCQIEMNDGQFNHHYNDFYNDINNEQKPNIGPTQQMDDEENLHPVDTVANNEEEGEVFKPKRHATRVQRFTCSATDIAGTFEVRPNLTTFDSDNVRTWVIPAAQSYLFGHIDGLVFISDRHASIEAGIYKVFPNATHLICCSQFFENVKKRFHRNDVAAIMDKAARSYTELKYNRHMEELSNLHQNTFNYVIEAGPHKWSRVHCLKIRYRVMTTNVTECINSCLKFARQLPMLTLAEFIRNMLQRWFHDRHHTTQSKHNQLIDAAHLVILKRVEKCAYMTVNPCGWNIFFVKWSRK